MIFPNIITYSFTYFVYYDAKSPKTFCTDVAEEDPLASTTMPTMTTRQVKAGRGRERRFDVYEEDGYFCFYFIFFFNNGWCKWVATKNKQANSKLKIEGR